MSTANEQSLKELNETSQQFRSDMEEKLSTAGQREEELLKELEDLKEDKKITEERLANELKETQEVVSTCIQVHVLYSGSFLSCIFVTIGANSFFTAQCRNYMYHLWL